MQIDPRIEPCVASTEAWVNGKYRVLVCNGQHFNDCRVGLLFHTDAADGTSWPDDWEEFEERHKARDARMAAIMRGDDVPS